LIAEGDEGPPLSRNFAVFDRASVMKQHLHPISQAMGHMTGISHFVEL
jgi:hypothetical protein